MLGKSGSTKALAILFVTGLLVYPQAAQARDWDRDHDRDHRVGRHVEVVRHYPSYGTISFGLPHGFISLSLGRSRYYYSDGVYYRRSWRGYTVIAPPVGARTKCFRLKAET